MKPLIDYSDFERLEIRVGTVVQVCSLDPIRLKGVIIDAGETVAAVVADRDAARLEAGRQVLVAVGLHPLRVQMENYTASVIAILSDERSVAPGIRVS